MSTFDAHEAKVPAAEHFVRVFNETVIDTTQALKDAQSRQENVKDKHRREQSFAVNDWVLLSTKNIKLKAAGTKKLMAKFIGPCKIVKQVGPVAYELDLPEGRARFHDMFHVSLLKLYHPAGARQPPPSKPPPFNIDDMLYYDVEDIVADRKRHTKGRGVCQEYLNKWECYDFIHNTWEPEHNLISCKGALQEYWHKQRDKLPPRCARKGVAAKGAKRGRPPPADVASPARSKVQAGLGRSGARPSATKRKADHQEGNPSNLASRRPVRKRSA